MLIYNKESTIVKEFTQEILTNSSIYIDNDEFIIVNFKHSNPKFNLYNYSFPFNNCISSWENKYFCPFCKTKEELQSFLRKKPLLIDIFGDSDKFLESEEKYNVIMFYILFEDVFDQFQESCFVSSTKEQQKIFNIINNKQFFSDVKEITGIEPLYAYQTTNFLEDYKNIEMCYTYVCYIGSKKDCVKINKYFANKLVD